MANSNYSKVEALFDEKRNAAQAEAERRKRELCEKSPEYRDVDEKIKLLGIELLRITQDISKDRSGEILEIKKNMKQLRELRTEILKGLGYAPDYVLTHYECSACEDTGLVGTKVCECFKKALRMENYKTSGLGKAMLRERFENFDISLYPADSRENMKNIFEFCREYAESFNKDNDSLLFIGGTGLGKTHLSSAIAMTVLDRGFDVVYDTAQNIFSVFEKNRFNRDDDETLKYLSCELLIIDDLGAETGGNMAESTLYNILNTRVNAQLPTIINTNLAPKDMKNKYDSRIISRLFGQFRILQFTGIDIRMQKLNF